jgi:hypothetical protein
MATKKQIKKVAVVHPRTKTTRQFDSSIYEPFKDAILKSLKGTKGVTFTELTQKVTPIIQKKMPGFKGSIPWYTISIRLDLENKGLVETFEEKGQKLNRLKR